MIENHDIVYEDYDIQNETVDSLHYYKVEGYFNKHKEDSHYNNSSHSYKHFLNSDQKFFKNGHTLYEKVKMSEPYKADGYWSYRPGPNHHRDIPVISFYDGQDGKLLTILSTNESIKNIDGDKVFPVNKASYNGTFEFTYGAIYLPPEADEINAYVNKFLNIQYNIDEFSHDAYVANYKGLHYPSFNQYLHEQVLSEQEYYEDIIEHIVKNDDGVSAFDDFYQQFLESDNKFFEYNGIVYEKSICEYFTINIDGANREIPIVNYYNGDDIEYITVHNKGVSTTLVSKDRYSKDDIKSDNGNRKFLKSAFEMDGKNVWGIIGVQKDECSIKILNGKSHIVTTVDNNPYSYKGYVDQFMSEAYPQYWDEKSYTTNNSEYIKTLVDNTQDSVDNYRIKDRVIVHKRNK